MRLQVSSLDLHYLVKELQGLVGCRVNKIFQKDKGFLFDLHSPGEGKVQFRILVPEAVFITKYKPEFAKTPPKFCMFLRKRLSGSFIKKVEQKGFDRILEITFEAGDKDYILILELFSKGNLVLCEDDYKIVSPLQSQTWQSRTIRGGTKYEYPPVQVNPKELDFKEFEGVLEAGEFDQVVKSLAVDIGLGGTYAEEACARAGVEKEASIADTELKPLFKAVKGLFEEDVKANSAGVKVFPFELETVDGDKDFYDSFNEAVDEVISRKLVARKEEEKESIKKEKVDKVLKIIEEQESRINKLKGDVIEGKRKGEVLFENYGKVSQLLHDFKQDVKEMSWDEIKEKYENHELVKQVNDKEGLIVIDL